MTAEITTIDAEKNDLTIHVDLCAQRYLLLEKRLHVLELKVDKINEDIVNGQKSLSTVIITSAGTVVVSIIGLITTIMLKLA
jgi:hypothetical protein